MEYQATCEDCDAVSLAYGAAMRAIDCECISKYADICAFIQEGETMASCICKCHQIAGGRR